MLTGRFEPFLTGVPMRVHIFALALLACLISNGCTNSEQPAAVSVVDSSRIFKESDPGKAGIKHLESLHESMQAELNDLQQQLQAKPDDAALQQKLQEKYMMHQQRISAEQQQVINALNDNIQKALDACRARKNLALILGTDAVLSYGPVADITQDVILEVNKYPLDFKPVDPDPAEIEAPAEADTPEKDAVAPDKK